MMHTPAHKACLANKTTEVPKDQKIALILSGSCTPGCDLLAMVNDGEITAREASQALSSKWHEGVDVHSIAASEIDYMRRNNI